MARSPRVARRPSCRACFLAIAPLLAASSAASGQTTVSWVAPLSGAWSDPANWSSNPAYPNNGTPPGSLYDAVITSDGYPDIDVTSDITIHSLTVNNPNTSINLHSGTFAATNGISLAAAGSSLYFPGDTGTLANTTVTGPGYLAVAPPAPYTYTPHYGTLNHVTLDANATGSYHITGGLTLLNNHTISSGTATFLGTQTISGTGSFTNATLQAPSVTGDVTTLDAGITLNNTSIEANSTGSLVINGTLHIDNAATIIAGSSGPYGPSANLHVNRVELAAGSLTLSGPFSLSQFSTFAWTGGTLNIDGYATFDRTLPAVAGPIVLRPYSTLRGYVPASPDNPIQVTGANTTLGGTFDDDVTVSPGANLTLSPSSTFNGTISLSGSGTTAGSITLADRTTLAGTGQIVFDAPSGSSLTVTPNRPTFPTSDDCTIAPDFTIRTGAGSGSLNATYGTITNSGTISAQTPYAAISIRGALLNQGTLRATNSSSLFLSGLFTNAAGHTVTVDSGANLTVTDDTNNAGTLAVSNATLALWDTFTNSGTISADNAALYLGGNWTNTGTISVHGGSLTLGPGALSGATTPTNTGTLSVSSATVTLAGADPAGLALDPANPFTDTALNVTAPYSTAQLRSVPLAGNASVTLSPGSAVDNAADTVSPTASLPWTLAGGSITGGALASPDHTPLHVIPPTPASATPGTLSAVSILSPVVIQDAGSLTLDGGSNASTLTANTGSTLSVTNAFTNTGAVNLLPGSTLAVNGPFSAPNPLSATGATILLPGNAAPATFTPAQLTSLISATSSTFRIAAGGTLDLAGGTLTPAPGGSTWDLYGGTLANATLATPLSASATPPTSVYDRYGPPSTLTNVTVASDLSIGTGAFITATGTILAPGGRILFDGSVAYYTLSGDTLAGAGDVVFNGDFGQLRSDASPLTIAPSITVRTGSGSGTVGYFNLPLTNLGTLSAESPGKLLTLTGSSFTNTGTLRATNGGTLALSFPNLTPAAFANLSVSSGGKVLIGGTLDNTSNTLTLSTPAFPLILNGTLNGGSITSPDGTHLPVTGGANLNSVDVDATVDVAEGAHFTATSVTFRRDVNIAPNASNYYSTTFAGNTTAAGLVSVSNAALTLTGSWNITGSLSLADDSRLYVNSPPAALPAHPISLTDSNLFLASPTVPLFNSFTRDHTPVTVSGTFVNTGNTITLSDANPLHLGTRGSSYPASIVGGTISTTAPGQFVVDGYNTTLSGLTLRGDLTLSDVTPTIAGSITLDNAHISLASTYASTGLRFSGDVTIAGTGDISFDGASAPTLSPVNSSTDRISVGPGVTLRSGTQGASLGLYSLDGTVSAQTRFKPISLSANTINGTLQATNGGSLTLTNTPTNYAAGTLTGGTYTVSGDSSITLRSISIRTNAANITLDGPGARLTALNFLHANTGSLTLTNGRTFTISTFGGTGLTNTGTITLGPDSALKVINGLTNTGTITLAGGSLLLDYATTSPIDALRDDLLTGHLTTSLPDAAIAYVEASQLHLTTYAGLPVDDTTLLTLLTLPGDANLDGQITPDDYALLDRSYARNTPNAHWQDGDFTYDGLVDASDYLLIDTTLGQAQGFSPGFLSQRESQFGSAYVSQLLTSVPEPALSSILYLLSSLLLPRRRRRRRHGAPA